MCSWGYFWQLRVWVQHYTPLLRSWPHKGSTGSWLRVAFWRHWQWCPSTPGWQKRDMDNESHDNKWLSPVLFSSLSWIPFLSTCFHLPCLETTPKRRLASWQYSVSKLKAWHWNPRIMHCKLYHHRQLPKFCKYQILHVQVEHEHRIESPGHDRNSIMLKSTTIKFPLPQSSIITL